MTMKNRLDERIVELAGALLPDARRVLEEAIRVPADYVDKPTDDGGDPECGLSNHEGPRLEGLRRAIIELGAVRRPEDVGFDAYGNLVWTVEREDDDVAPEDKRVVFFDGHTDTVRALRAAWREKIGGGIDAYDGWGDAGSVDEGFLDRELGHLPPRDDWDQLIFGRGSADQLGGVVAQVLATRILLELEAEGALDGVVVRSYATVAEEDNDGAGPMYVMRKELAGAPPERIPDVVVLTEGTGDAAKGPLGIYRGQRGRMQIEVSVTGRSCHGSMPWEGLNPLEYAGAILVEAAQQHQAREGFLEDDFLGGGTRTASWARLDTPSDCAVPDRFVFRFDRRLTVGETPDAAVAAVEGLDAVAAARAAGLDVDVLVPTYDKPTWCGYEPGNPQIYLGWVTPEDHAAIQCARTAYKRVVTPTLATFGGEGWFREEPRVDRWIFSTDGVGFPLPVEGSPIDVPASKDWVASGDAFVHPPMFGFGPGIEQNTHKIGECVDQRELRCAIAFLARFPSLFAQR